MHSRGGTIEPSLENLEAIQNKKIPLGGHEEIASIVFCERFLDYNKNWAEIDSMLDEMTSETYRQKFADSSGRGWRYSWFIMDWAGFETNPRLRDIGYHNIYDHYRERPGLDLDGFYWHAHPMSTYREAHRCANSFLNSPHIFQSLARRLIDRGEFPSCFRAGFHTERPDSHWFLEQYIPYDFSNQAVEPTELDRQQQDLAGGRFGDWRRAPAKWEPYHPAHEDYQMPGSCNRVIFRCLNVGTRLRLLTQEEVNNAFRRADEGSDTVLAFTDHDFRNMRPDVEEVYQMLTNAAKEYPEITWIHATAEDAARKVLRQSAGLLNMWAETESDGAVRRLRVETDSDTFGPQPFLAVKMAGGRYTMENFDFQLPRRMWTYTFDENSIHFNDVEKIGIATHSRNGSGALKVIGRDGRVFFERRW